MSDTTRLIALDADGAPATTPATHLITRDTKTGLEWADPSPGKRLTQKAAAKACQALTLNDEGWRLPTRDELLSIVDITRFDPAVDPDAFPFVKPIWYWTSDAAAWSSASAWGVIFRQRRRQRQPPRQRRVRVGRAPRRSVIGLSAMTAQHVPPLQRQALLAALDAPTHTLRRMRRVFVALDGDVRTSGVATVHTVTPRMALRLEREGLVDFDEPLFPNVFTLNAKGVALAQQLRDGERGKAGAA